MLPNRSAAAPHAWASEAFAAGPPSPSGPFELVPAGVVSQSVAVVTLRTAWDSASSRWPPRYDTPHGPTRTCVALAGPPTPPATVEITPAGPAWTARAA